jgi:pyruvate oxidase
LTLGKISKEQLAGDFPVWHTSLINPDWAEFARSCGALGLRVDHGAQLDGAMADLFAAEGPALLVIEQDAELL